MKKLNVLSLFNGMSFGAMALEHCGIEVENYYSSEIDKYANQATQALYPDTIQLGDVTSWREWVIDWSSIDLVTGGFPCQAWSIAGKQLGDKDERGMLFWTMLDIMKHVRCHNPKADFLIENVKMKKEFEEYITTHTENALWKVHKILINSALVSAQNRNRYYWTSFPVGQPKRIKTSIADYVDFSIDAKQISPGKVDRVMNSKFGAGKYVTRETDKCGTIIALYAKQPSDAWYVLRDDGKVTMLTPLECMRLQTVPERHIDTLLNAGISNTQLYKMTGNGWTMLVIAHILSCLFNN